MSGSVKTEGIVIRQTQTTGARRMLLLFTREAGKISAGAYASQSGKSAQTLAFRPFTRGLYELRETRPGFFSVTHAEVVDACFALGENADRYAEASYVLEFTDKILPERCACPEIYDLLTDTMDLLQRRKEDFRLPTLAFMVRILQLTGVFPERAEVAGELRIDPNDDILNCVSFLMECPVKRIEKLTLDAENEERLFASLRRFAGEQLEFGALKSETMLTAGWKGENPWK